MAARRNAWPDSAGGGPDADPGAEGRTKDVVWVVRGDGGRAGGEDRAVGGAILLSIFIVGFVHVARLISKAKLTKLTGDRETNCQREKDCERTWGKREAGGGGRVPL